MVNLVNLGTLAQIAVEKAILILVANAVIEMEVETAPKAIALLYLSNLGTTHPRGRSNQKLYQ
jgi:hypothetical protein